MAIQDISNPITFLGGYVKRFTASLGFNSNPTTVDLEIIPGSVNNAYDVSFGATGFDFVNAEPGKMSGFQFGAFKYIGVIQSWTEVGNSSNYKSYNVKLADPRFIFDKIPIVIGPNVVCSGYSRPNFINMFGASAGPSGAGFTGDGTLFRNIRDYLQSSGIINLFGKQLSFVFGSGFQDGTGSVNPQGIAPWYQVRSPQISLAELFNQVASDQGFDYYLTMQYSGYSAAATSPMRLETIKRTIPTGTNQISGFISGWVSSGILTAYQRGRELRPEANTAIVTGPAQTVWFGSNTNDIYSYWGEARDGSALFNTSSPQSGMVLLDYIVGSGVPQTLSDSVFRINYTKHTISKSFTNIYPPKLSIGVSAATTTGYYASDYVMRAALHSQPAWEAMMFRYQVATANKLGINFQVFTPAEDLITAPQDVRLSMLQRFIPSGIGDRPPQVQALISAVYEATRQTAEQYYGKKYIVQMDTAYSTFVSNWLTNGTFVYDNGFPGVEYEVIDAAWSPLDGAGFIPNGVQNHNSLHATDNPTFKDGQGRLKGFFSYRNYNTAGNANFPYMIDTTVISNSHQFVEQGNKLCVPVSAELYKKFPKYLIFDISQDVQGITGGRFAASGNADIAPYYDFLAAMGYTDQQISCWNLLSKQGENRDFGMAAPRRLVMDSAPDNYGLFVPMVLKTCTFGPYVASGTRFGGVNFSSQSDLTPERFNSYANQDLAGADVAARNVSTLDVIDQAEITLAGFPQYDLGASIGDNSNVTSLSVQYGVDGFTTTYSLKTFALPSIRVTQLLNDRITRVQNFNRYTDRRINDLTKQITELQKARQKLQDRITRPDQISPAALAAGNSTRGGNNAAAHNYSFINGLFYPADDQGNYLGC